MSPSAAVQLRTTEKWLFPGTGDWVWFGPSVSKAQGEVLSLKSVPGAVGFYIVGKHCDDGFNLLLKSMKFLHGFNEGGPPCKVFGVEGSLYYCPAGWQYCHLPVSTVLEVRSCHPELCLPTSVFLRRCAEQGEQQNMEQQLFSEGINGRCDPAKTAYVGQSWTPVKWSQAYGTVGV